MTLPRMAVAAASPSEIQKAQALAQHLQLPFIQDANSEAAKAYDDLLLLTPFYLGLLQTRDKKSPPFYLNLISAQLTYRREKASMRNEFLVRAMGLKQGEHPFIIDATAGLLRDSFILASLGFQVTALERSPIIHALAEDALIRAAADARTKPITQRISLICTDSVAWLRESSLKNKQRPDIIYLDPMFPPRKKSASVKKEMVILHHLLRSDVNENILLETALACAMRRVVVKRPRLAATLANVAPDFSIVGKSSRFDVYLNKENISKA